MRVCVRCGNKLTPHQKKYCCACGNEVRREQARERARRLRGNGEENTHRNRKKTAAYETEFMAWEADLCLNCTRGRCVNCLENKRQREKEKMLKESGGKKWRD